MSLETLFENLSKTCIKCEYFNDTYNLVPLPNKGRLYIGSIDSLNHVNDLDIKYILTLVTPVDKIISDHEIVDIDDIGDSFNIAKMEKILETYVPIIKERLAKGDNVLIHCFAGISRSATVTLQVIKETLNLNIYDACMYLQMIRPIICPNWYFLKTIAEN